LFLSNPHPLNFVIGNRLAPTTSAKSASIKGRHERLTSFFLVQPHMFSQAKESPHDSLSLLPPEAIYETQGIVDSNNARLFAQCSSAGALSQTLESDQAGNYSRRFFSFAAWGDAPDSPRYPLQQRRRLH
jgi:hypothetical protein